MSDEWDESDSDSAPAKPAAPPPKPIKKSSKWEGEDEDDDGPASDWDASSDDEEKPKAAPTTSAAPPKKKGTLKAKLAQKEAERQARLDAGDDEEYDSDAVLDPRDKARRDRERELNADLSNAADLLGSAALGGTSSSELDSLISAQPRTKDDFVKFSNQIIEVIIKRHQSKPLYPAFIEHLARELCMPLKDVEVRKVASGLTTLSNEKQKEQRDKASGKKKPKAAGKPILGATKASGRVDTGLYDEALDDFGSNADDFM
ncbi:Eukaryotic translation initiation factor 3 subunit J [Mycena chlorophos]|uniref:Eukaryotic translation initiation factor 3 subunit J n=1 Tax=Mycena chlorophos TaxID=658473 RepID=A0A8H6WFE5_MYCCL|nr:Eukaryotic translation initiation factor 3 subunit J [Mycena chlorophos]